MRPKSKVMCFPHDLLEGKDVIVWIETKELAHDLKQEGFSGTISFKGFYRDAIGKEYKSEAMKFNIEKA